MKSVAAYHRVRSQSCKTDRRFPRDGRIGTSSSLRPPTSCLHSCESVYAASSKNAFYIIRKKMGMIAPSLPPTVILAASVSPSIRTPSGHPITYKQEVLGRAVADAHHTVRIAGCVLYARWYPSMERARITLSACYTAAVLMRFEPRMRTRRAITKAQAPYSLIDLCPIIL